MSTYLENYCTIEDIQLVAPFVFDYDRKRVISNWVSHSGSGATTIYKAGSVGKLSMLYSNDIELTSVSDIASVDADGKFFFDEDADVVYYRPTSTNDPNFDESVAAGRDNKTLFTEFISRSSDFVRSYINKPIYKNKGVGTGDSLGRDFPEVIVRSTALLSASLAIMAYDREKGEELQNLAYNPNDNNGLLDLIRRGVISLDQDEDGRDKIVKEVAINTSSTGTIVDTFGHPTVSYDRIKVIIASGGTFSAGSTSTITYNTFVGNDNGLKIDQVAISEVIDGSFQSIGHGIYVRFSTGVYTTGDEWEVEVSGLDHTSGGGINTIQLKRN
jgi:hypothetical protein|tara:strand:- start:108 stop:1094 length:987 start_codon:yes stop_codon:yes gene_type:complete